MDVGTIGLVGVVLYLSSYFLLQLGRIDGNGICYCMLNGAGAACVLISLTVQYNLPSVLIQTSWIAISLIGVARHLAMSAVNTHDSAPQTPATD